MRNNIYLSTSSFKNVSLKGILDLCLEHDIHNIELSFVEYSDENQSVVREYRDNHQMKFLVHNYYPRPKEDFVLNLASNDQAVLGLSINHCKQAIDLSKELGAPFYSVHAGFAFHAQANDLGKPQVSLPRIPYAQAYDNFLKSVQELCGYAREKGIKLLIENNVIASFNLVNGKNEILLLVDDEEALKFYDQVQSDNLAFLIDLAHLKVSSAALKFDKYQYLERLKSLSPCCHLSDNDGSADQGLTFNEDVWFADFVKENKDKTFVLEFKKGDIEQYKQCCQSLEKMLNEHDCCTKT